MHDRSSSSRSWHVSPTPIAARTAAPRRNLLHGQAPVARASKNAPRNSARKRSRLALAAVSGDTAQIAAEAGRSALSPPRRCSQAPDVDLADVMAELERREGTSGLAEKASRPKRLIMEELAKRSLALPPLLARGMGRTARRHADDADPGRPRRAARPQRPHRPRRRWRRSTCRCRACSISMSQATQRTVPRHQPFPPPQRPQGALRHRHGRQRRGGQEHHGTHPAAASGALAARTPRSISSPPTASSCPTPCSSAKA